MKSLNLLILFIWARSFLYVKSDCEGKESLTSYSNCTSKSNETSKCCFVDTKTPRCISVPFENYNNTKYDTFKDNIIKRANETKGDNGDNISNIEQVKCGTEFEKCMSVSPTVKENCFNYTGRDEKNKISCCYMKIKYSKSTHYSCYPIDADKDAIKKAINKLEDEYHIQKGFLPEDRGKYVDKEIITKIVPYSILDIPSVSEVFLPNTPYSTKENLLIHKYNEIIITQLRWMEIKSFKLTSSRTRKSIQCFHIKNTVSTDPSHVILFNQKTKTNFIANLPFLVDLSCVLKTSIVTYEYVHRDSKSKIIEDCSMLYDYLCSIDSISKVSLFGMSEGCYINISMIKNRMKKLNKIVLLSPTWVYSPHVLKNTRESNRAKTKLNLAFEHLNSMGVEVMVVHGKKDTYVKYLLSLSLCRRIKNCVEWYPNEGDHDNIIECYRTKLYKKLKVFLKESTPKKREEKSLESNFGSLVNEVSTPMFENNNKFLQPKQMSFSNIGVGNNSKEESKESVTGCGTFRPGDIVPSFTNEPYNSLTSSKVKLSITKDGSINCEGDGFTFIDRNLKEKIVTSYNQGTFINEGGKITIDIN